MLKVLSTKRMTFHRADIVKHDRTNQLMRVIHESCEVQNSPVTAQVIPDWCKTDDLFSLAVQDGTLVVVGGGK